MTITLHGNPRSTCTRLVALVCREKQIPYNLVTIDLRKGEHKAPDFVKHQPFGQIPYINDDGFILYESRAIVRYLIKKHPNQGTPELIPTGLREEALFEQAASIEAFNFNPFVSSIAAEKLFKPLRGLQTDVKVVEERLAQLNAKLDAYEVILSKQRYLAGDNVTLADLQHLPYGTVLITAGGYPDLFKGRPSVERWWNELYNRPTWQEIISSN